MGGDKFGWRGGSGKILGKSFLENIVLKSKAFNCHNRYFLNESLEVSQNLG